MKHTVVQTFARKYVPGENYNKRKSYEGNFKITHIHTHVHTHTHIIVPLIERKKNIPASPKNGNYCKTECTHKNKYTHSPTSK